MRTTTLLLSALLALGLALPTAAGGGKTHDETATVVSSDTVRNTITLYGADGKESTAPVEGDAQKVLATIKAGDKVTVTCRDDDKGAHVAVTAIKKG